MELNRRFPGIVARWAGSAEWRIANHIPSPNTSSAAPPAMIIAVKNCF